MNDAEGSEQCISIVMPMLYSTKVHLKSYIFLILLTASSFHSHSVKNWLYIWDDFTLQVVCTVLVEAWFKARTVIFRLWWKENTTSRVSQSTKIFMTTISAPFMCFCYYCVRGENRKASAPLATTKAALTLFPPTNADSRHPFSKAWQHHIQTVILPCMWFRKEPSQFCGPNSKEPNLFHNGETTYRVGWMSEYATDML